MARYLPRFYDPVPDELLRNDADASDLVRRIARNQNWIWANHGAVHSAWAAEPLLYSTAPFLEGGQSTDVAVAVHPATAVTGSNRVRVSGYVSVGVTTAPAGAVLRAFQLLPGEAVPSYDSPFDDVVLPTASGESSFEAFLRIRSGADPIRIAFRLIGPTSGDATYYLLSLNVAWERSSASVLGETPAAWAKGSQAFVAADRALSARLLRYISNQTLGLRANRESVLMAHSFDWPRRSSLSTGSTRQALYGISCPWSSQTLNLTVRALLVGQNAVGRVRVYIDGAFVGTTANFAAPTLKASVYRSESAVTFTQVLAAGNHKVELYGEITTVASGNTTGASACGLALLNVHATLSQNLSAADRLVGAETVPASYQPLDDAACAPGRPIVAQDERFGLRGGPAYLMNNLAWLLQNRTGATVIADWLHRTNSAGWSGAGDGVVANQTLVENTALYYPMAGQNEVPFSESPPVDARQIKDGGDHYLGSTLAKMTAIGMNGAPRLRIMGRPEVRYMKDAPGDSDNGGIWVGRDASLVNIAKMVAAPRLLLAGVSVADTTYATGTLLWLTGVRFPVQDSPKGMMIALHALFIHELPLTQADLDALP